MEHKRKIALGGGCHWCTEAVFQSIVGVDRVDQGYVASVGKNSGFSEAVVLHYDSQLVALEILIEIHLLTHKSTSNHSMRHKYRSAIYVYSERQLQEVKRMLQHLQVTYDDTFITKVLPFREFEPSREAITNYYYNDPEKPFCETFINPKLKLLIEKFSNHMDLQKVAHLQIEINTIN